MKRKDEKTKRILAISNQFLKDNFKELATAHEDIELMCELLEDIALIAFNAGADYVSSDMFNSGYARGLQDGKKLADADSWSKGYDIGYKVGREKANTKYNVGFEDGLKEGMDNVAKHVNAAYNEGVHDASTASEVSLSKQKKRAYDRGYSAGKRNSHYNSLRADERLDGRR